MKIIKSDLARCSNWILFLFLMSCSTGADLSGAQQSQLAAAPIDAVEIHQEAALKGDCPQNRKTPQAPASFLKMKNPVADNERAIKDGRLLYQETAKPISCVTCHGSNGDGNGDPDFASTPPARNFSCKETMQKLPDGQLFWIIKNGSPNTSMFSFKNLSDNDVWSLISYLRSLAS